MIAFLSIWILLIAGAAVFPTLALRKHESMSWWDYAFPFTGIAAWFPLGMSNIGSTVSLSNFVVEVFWISVVSVLIPWIRWVLFRFDKAQIKILSFYLTFLPVVVAIVIRLAMPTLPE